MQLASLQARVFHLRKKAFQISSVVLFHRGVSCFFDLFYHLLVSVFLLMGLFRCDCPAFNATRAVTIQARPEEIWPWLVQIGITRAGWYSYDWLDNLGKPSAQRILPQFQHVAVGDVVPISPDGKQGMYVKDFEANQFMLWWDQKGEATW